MGTAGREDSQQSFFRQFIRGQVGWFVWVASKAMEMTETQPYKRFHQRMKAKNRAWSMMMKNVHPFALAYHTWPSTSSRNR